MRSARVMRPPKNWPIHWCPRQTLELELSLGKLLEFRGYSLLEQDRRGLVILGCAQEKDLVLGLGIFRCCVRPFVPRPVAQNIGLGCG